MVVLDEFANGRDLVLEAALFKLRGGGERDAGERRGDVAGDGNIQICVAEHIEADDGLYAASRRLQLFGGAFRTPEAVARQVCLHAFFAVEPQKLDIETRALRAVEGGGEREEERGCGSAIVRARAAAFRIVMRGEDNPRRVAGRLEAPLGANVDESPHANGRGGCKPVEHRRGAKRFQMRSDVPGGGMRPSRTCIADGALPGEVGNERMRVPRVGRQKRQRRRQHALCTAKHRRPPE